MNFFQKLDHNLWTSFVVLGVSLIGFACSCFLISTDMQDIPFGFLLAGGIIAFIHVFSFLMTLIDKRRGTTVFTIIAMIFRLVIVLASLVVVALMYYKWNIKLFNIFVFVGMYTVGVIVLCITFIFKKD